MTERIRRDVRDGAWGDGGAEPLGAPLDEAVLRLRGADPDDAAVDADAVGRVMDAVRDRPRPRRETTPAAPAPPAARPMRWRQPLLAGTALAAAALLLVAVAVRGRDGGAPATDSATGEPAASAPGVRRVRFTLVAPPTARVSLVGDFNAWNAGATPMRWDAAAGAWAVEVPLPTGRYAYSFVLDGERWVADPNAPLAPDDGLGAPSSVVVVSGESRAG